MCAIYRLHRNFNKLIKKVFKHFSEEYSFESYKPTVLLRLNNDVLHIINFDKGSAGFACDIAIQPLYVPSDSIVLSFGNRLSRFKVYLQERWDYGQSEQELENNLIQVKELLVRNALPWFEEVGHPQGIVSFIEMEKKNRKSLTWCPPFQEYLYLGFSYLYLKKYDLAEIHLRSATDALDDNDWTWVIERKALINEMRRISNTEPESIEIKLEEFVEQTKMNLRLKR